MSDVNSNADKSEKSAEHWWADEMVAQVEAANKWHFGALVEVKTVAWWDSSYGYRRVNGQVVRDPSIDRRLTAYVPREQLLNKVHGYGVVWDCVLVGEADAREHLSRVNYEFGTDTKLEDLPCIVQISDDYKFPGVDLDKKVKLYLLQDGFCKVEPPDQPPLRPVVKPDDPMLAKPEPIERGPVELDASRQVDQPLWGWEDSYWSKLTHAERVQHINVRAVALYAFEKALVKVICCHGSHFCLQVEADKVDHRTAGSDFINAWLILRPGKPELTERALINLIIPADKDAIERITLVYVTIG